MGYWAMVKRGWAAKREGFRATRLTVGASNDLQMERNLTGGLPVIYQGHSANLGPFRERFSPAHETRSERATGACGSVGSRNGQCGKGPDASFEKHEDEMQMMTWKNATRKQMTWQQRRITGRRLAHRIRGVTHQQHSLPNPGTRPQNSIIDPEGHTSDLRTSSTTKRASQP